MKLISSSVDVEMYKAGSMFSPGRLVDVRVFRAQFEVEDSTISLKVDGGLAVELGAIAHEAFADADIQNADASDARARAIFAYLAKHVGTQP
jgi:hypothetical protein